MGAGFGVWGWKALLKCWTCLNGFFEDLAAGLGLRKDFICMLGLCFDVMNKVGKYMGSLSLGIEFYTEKYFCNGRLR